MQRNFYFRPIMFLLMGGLLFASVADSPAFQAYRAVDVLRLISVGMLFGVGGMWLAFPFLVRRVRVP